MFLRCFLVICLLILGLVQPVDAVVVRARPQARVRVVAPAVRVVAPIPRQLPAGPVIVVPPATAPLPGPVERLNIVVPIPQASARKSSSTQTSSTVATPSGTRTVQTSSVTSQEGAVDALDEVNAARARRGLRPFLRDPLLTIGAMNIARQRAARLIAGHTANDFAGLPAGARAAAAGAGALAPSWGWGSCCTYDNYASAGAALVYGADGKRYMSLFVR